MPDGPVNQPVSSQLNPRLIPASTTVLQPGSRYFRLVDAFAQLDQSQAVIALQSEVGALQADIAALQGSVSTLQSQMTTVQGQISTLQAQMAVQQGFMNSFNWVQLEQATGLTFLDSRNLYTRSFVISGALAAALGVFTYAHGIPNINYVASVQAIAGQNSGQNIPITWINAQQVPSVQDAISCFVDTTNIYIFNGSVLRTTMLVLVKLYYTATDR